MFGAQLTSIRRLTSAANPCVRSLDKTERAGIPNGALGEYGPQFIRDNGFLKGKTKTA